MYEAACRTCSGLYHRNTTYGSFIADDRVTSSTYLPCRQGRYQCLSPFSSCMLAHPEISLAKNKKAIVENKTFRIMN